MECSRIACRCKRCNRIRRVITKQQGLEAEDWVNHLAETYNVSRPILLHNYTKVVVMNEDQVEESIELMQDLLKYYKAVIEG